MKISFPSPEFDDAVAGVCHDSASDEQIRGLNELLRNDAAARDEYILRLELHSRLASDADLFALANRNEVALSASILRAQAPPRAPAQKLAWMVALAACVAIFAIGWRALRPAPSTERQGATSKAVAMLDRAVDALWNPSGEPPRLGAPLEPGWLRLDSGLAQIVFYSGARVVIEGPAELQVISPSEAFCRTGRLTADVPPQARGFSIRTPQVTLTDVGTVLGLDVRGQRTELHSFKGSASFELPGGAPEQDLQEGRAAVVESPHPLRVIPADRSAFASLFNLQVKSVAAEARRCNQWRAASLRLGRDPSLLIHFAFERETDWRLPNTSSHSSTLPDGAIVGCQWIEGRWSDKRALEFRNVNDRVRLSVPGEFDALTVAAWVRVQGLDRTLNSLFMSDGFDPGTIHWLIRNDGVLGLTVIGHETNRFQICTSEPVLTLDQFGMWLHLAVVLDGNSKRVVHYVNGRPVGGNTLRIRPPFRVNASELGNWNANGFPKEDPFLIRNFSGAMDEFCLFSRPLTGDEIAALYAAGKPQPDPLFRARN